MLGQIMRLLLTGTCRVILAEAAFATTVTIHTDDARATLPAMQNPSLTREDAATIAKMHGNQGVLRKLHEWKIPVTIETFANALIVDYPEVLCAWELNWRVIAKSLSETHSISAHEEFPCLVGRFLPARHSGAAKMCFISGQIMLYFTVVIAV
jgi:hypothetical protein